jgi:hypothetical protein
MTMRLPFEIRKAVVAVCGKAFWLKDPFRAFLLSCGVLAGLYDRYADESKFKITRHVLAELIRKYLSGKVFLSTVNNELIVRELEDGFQSQPGASRSDIPFGVCSLGVPPQIAHHVAESATIPRPIAIA